MRAWMESTRWTPSWSEPARCGRSTCGSFPSSAPPLWRCRPLGCTALAYLVSERKRELGLRIALGAAPRHVTGLVMRRALLLTTIGLGAGFALAAALARFAQSLLFEVRPFDPGLVTFVSIAILVVAAIASYVPGRRAAAIDPATVLRMNSPGCSGLECPRDLYVLGTPFLPLGPM